MNSASKMILKKIDQPLVWIDCEMTGLNHLKDRIIEICCVITDGQLNIHGGIFHAVIHQSDEVLQNMNQWCIDQHGRSGLTQRVRESLHSTKSIETNLLNFLRERVEPGVGLLAGNSVHVDKLFLLREMPSIISHLHYRIMDVSTISEACSRFSPEHILKGKPEKKLNHTAESDILESIQELRYYQKEVFQGKNLKV